MENHSSSAPRVVSIRSEPIELAQFLKFSGLVESGGGAKQLIADGLVSVNSEVETRKGRKLHVGDRVTCGEETLLVNLA